MHVSIFFPNLPLYLVKCSIWIIRFLLFGSIVRYWFAKSKELLTTLLSTLLIDASFVLKLTSFFALLIIAFPNLLVSRVTIIKLNAYYKIYEVTWHDSDELTIYALK